MKMLQQHPDGLVYVRDDIEMYSDTPENFALDHGQPLPPLPPRAVERVYEPGRRHALSDGESVIDGGPMPWSFGDEAIAMLPDLLARQAARQPPPPPPLPPPSVLIISDRQFFQALAMQGKITQDEALAAVSIGAIPAELKEFIEKLTDPQEVFAVRMLLSGATQFDRHHPLVAQMAYAFGLNDDEIDALWHFAATL